MGGKTSTTAKDRWNAKTYCKMTIRIRKDGADGVTVDTIRRRAGEDNMSVNAWILDCIKDKI